MGKVGDACGDAIGKVGKVGKAADARCVESQEPQMKKYVHASRPQSTETPVN